MRNNYLIGSSVLEQGTLNKTEDSKLKKEYSHQTFTSFFLMLSFLSHKIKQWYTQSVSPPLYTKCTESSSLLSGK